MDSNKDVPEARPSKVGWKVVTAGDNGIDLLQFHIEVGDLSEASRIVENITSMIMKYERPDNVFNTQLTLRDWAVQVQIALPVGTWGTKAQQELTDKISELYIS